LIIKAHHVFADGYGLITFYTNIADNAEEIKLGHLRRMTFIEQILIYLTLPWHFVTITLRLFLWPKNINPLAKDVNNSGVKKGLLAKEYSIATIKEKSKQYGVTLNDLVLAVLSMTIKRYFVSKGETQINEILIMVPWNFR
jgi:hypothetical protein